MKTAFAAFVGVLPLLAALGRSSAGKVPGAVAPGARAKAPPHASSSRPGSSHESSHESSSSRPSSHGGLSSQASHEGPPHPFFHVAPPLPMLPSVSRVRVEATRDRVVVTEEIALPRGDWERGSIDLYAAFGEPGTPIAVDARLVPVPTGQLESRWEDAGEAVPVETATRHLPSSRLLLGRPTMAGVVLHVRDSLLRAAYAGADVAALRIRSLLAAPTPDATGMRDIVVRLGIDGGLPLALDKVQVVSAEASPWITRAEASLCGPEADEHLLTVSLQPRPADAPPWGPTTVAPQLATRHASDDLCVRWWAPAE